MAPNPAASNPVTIIGESINEISKYDANNLYNVIKDFPNLKELFSKINNIDDIKEILSNSRRFYIYVI